jgi:KDO2-lipid IV(A) lauroyltransferase
VRFFLWTFIKLFGALPFRLRSSFGRLLGKIVFALPSRDKQIAALQIRCFLKLESSKTILQEVYANLGATLFECLNLEPLIKNPDQFIEFKSWPEAQRLLAQKRGIVALTAHIGNWDAMGAFFANKNIPLTAIAKQARNRAVQSVLEELRASFGFKTIWRANKRGVLEILDLLKTGEVIAALIDQDTRVSSVAVPFFGQPANTPSTIVEIGKKAEALFVTAFVVRNKNGKFEIYVEEISNSLATQEILNEYNCRLEKIIQEYPSQWAWIHKRWRTTPENHRLGSREYKEYLESLVVKSHNVA